MDRGAWQATVHGVTRVGHDLATREREEYFSNVCSFWDPEFHFPVGILLT